MSAKGASDTGRSDQLTIADTVGDMTLRDVHCGVMVKVAGNPALLNQHCTIN